ncbi:MAG: type IV pilus assembly protein PilM [Phycisphaerae bacterium]|jgi:type IV pilus assembly protein PilM
MATAQTIWGIDLGRCALKAIKLRAAGENQVEIVATDYVEHAKILSQPDADRHELIRAALEKFLSRNDLSKDSTVVSVPGQHTLARFTKLPPVAPKRIPDIVRYEADQQIPFDMDEVIWDYQTFQQEGTPDLEVGIFAMKRELIREHLLHFEQASIEPVAVQSGPLAVYNAARFDGQIGDETTILLDIGAENTDLIIATAESFWTRTVPIGGNKFTEALAKSFKLSFAKAEGLKRTAESSKYARQIFQAMRPVFADLVQELQRSIGFYSSTHRDTQVEKVVGFGNAFQLPGLHKYLQQNLGLSIDRPTSFAHATVTGSADKPEFKENFPAFAVAYGSALQGLDLAKVESNLLPTEIAKQIVWRKKRPAFAAVAACLVLAGGLIWFRQTTDIKALADAGGAPNPINVDQAWDIVQRGPSSSLPRRAQAQAIYKAADYLKKELSRLQNEGAAERTETEALIAAQQSKAMIPAIMQVVHESVPKPEGALADAQTQGAVLAAITDSPTPRSKRRHVTIEDLIIRYEPDVNAYEWASIVEVEGPINDPGAALPAVKIEIVCRTPNEGGAKFITDAFMDVLRKNGRRPDTGFYFDRVYLWEGNRVETTRPASARVGAGGRGAAAGVAPAKPGDAPASAAGTVAGLPPEDVDPITLEPIAGDWRFVIWIDAVLEDYPYADEEAEADDGE